MKIPTEVRKMWGIKIKNKNQTLWTKETGTKSIFVDVRKMFEHSGYNPRSLWYVFYGNNQSDLNADYISTSREKAEKNAKEWMRQKE